MKFVLSSLMLCGCVLLIDGPSSAQEPVVDCGKAETQNEMTYCAEQDYLAADKALNAQWKLTKKIVVDWDKQLEANARGAEEALMKGQRAWITYRDGQCEAAGFAARGGTMEPMLIYACQAEMTTSRTEELKQLAETIGQ
ncbi:lysozyme inhibitor LprI family protein [Rhizobium sp. FY34]|uniref:lysozyme inhibitor LprI family protein n=1 Tax=Rhizobium sp. FY34 TaxID=2562309 RepID=UPI0010C038B8|nr:lysozyme inhibitor LprI family protein [Rhizobium sp. FY34]